MLACIDRETVDVMLEQLDSHADSTVLSSGSLHRELALVRTRGLATCSLAAVSFVGAPLFDHEHRNVGGISLCDGADRVRDAKLVHVVRNGIVDNLKYAGRISPPVERPVPS